MRKLYYLLVLTLILVGCAPGVPANPAKTEAPETSSTGSTTIDVEPAPSQESCLSPALHMNAERAAHTATLLPDGTVLIAGGFREEGTAEIAISSAELFDPATNTFRPTSDLNEPRTGQTATLLPNGQVLLAGGWNERSRSSTAELYDPETGMFAYTGSLMKPRQGMTATLLKNGQVLIAGGDIARNTPQLTAELYDPENGTFTSTGNLHDGRIGHTATLLADGRVLLVGGSAGHDEILATAEIYDPETGTFTVTNPAHVVRYKHTAVLLDDGNVLILGGTDRRDWSGKYNSAEIYNVKTGTFRKTANLHQARFKLADAAVLLSSGNVLVGGGNRQIEIFDAQTQTFLLGDKLDSDYFFTVLTRLENGHVLITGGYDANIQPSSKAWLHCA